MSYFIPPGLGWQPDLPDYRDYTPHHPQVEPILRRMGVRERGSRLRGQCDLRDENLLPPAEDQGPLNSSCAFAVLGMVEYLERRYSGRALEPSKLFLYQLALKLSGSRGDSGVSLRTTLKALSRFGTPPARFWPYDRNRFETNPLDPFLYGFSYEYQSLRYFRLDAPSVAALSGEGQIRADADEMLANIKRFLDAGLPCVCGFIVPSALTSSPHVPIPNGRDQPRGGQAVLVLGYDDDYPSQNKKPRSQRQRKASVVATSATARGALLIHNSWSAAWGEGGHGWLPYRFIERGLADNFWSVIKPEWTEA